MAVDAENGPTIPATGAPVNNEYTTLLASRQQLPVYQKRDEFLPVYQKNDITIFVGETGSGKSTQIPQQVWMDSVPGSLDGQLIAVTQPRRFAATNVSLAIVPYSLR